MRWGRREHVSTTVGPALNERRVLLHEKKNTFLVVVRQYYATSYVLSRLFFVVVRQCSTPGLVL